MLVNVEAIILRRSRRKWLRYLVASIGFTACGIFLMNGPRKPADVSTGLDGILFFGFCALVAAWQLLTDRPQVVIDDRGVFMRSARLGLIPWNEILDAQVLKGQGMEVIWLQLADPKRFVDGLGPSRRWVIRLNEIFGFKPICFSVNGLEVQARAIAEVIVKEVSQRRASAKN